VKNFKSCHTETRNDRERKKKDNFNDYYGTMMEACNTNKPATGASFYI
jgi:hypothetical protein